MAEIQAFRGIRYDSGHVGSLGDVVAPPYDVIDSALQDQLYKRHPANVIRLILNREEPGDDEHNNRYTRSARFLKNWRSEGVLQTDPHPALYVYHQQFNFGGESFTRRGFMARVRLQRFGEGTIYPHEETHSAAKADRLKLTRACRANLSQIFGIYPDGENEAQQRLEQAIENQLPFEAADHLGVVHRMWPVTDAHAIADVAAALAPCPVFVADGHHRYETACNYREELAGGRPLDPEHPANFVLMMMVSMNDPGLIVYPTHRLFRGLNLISSEQLAATLAPCFQCRVAGEGPDLADVVWESLEREGEQGTIAFYTAADDRWTVARVQATGRERMAHVAPEHSRQWQALGVSLLHRLVVEDLLGQHDLPAPDYVHQVSEVVTALQGGAADFPLAALVMPATVDHVRVISEHGERMPAKSTYFFPKLLSGLVIHPLE